MSKVKQSRAKQPPMDQEFETASKFHKQFIDKLDHSSFFRILLEHFNYYFFSHLSSVKLEVLKPGDVMIHFFDFFTFSTSIYQGKDIGRAYSCYYVQIWSNFSKNSRRKRATSNSLSGISCIQCTAGLAQALSSEVSSTRLRKPVIWI